MHRQTQSPWCKSGFISIIISSNTNWDTLGTAINISEWSLNEQRERNCSYTTHYWATLQWTELVLNIYFCKSWAKSKDVIGATESTGMTFNRNNISNLKIKLLTRKLNYNLRCLMSNTFLLVIYWCTIQWFGNLQYDSADIFWNISYIKLQYVYIFSKPTELHFWVFLSKRILNITLSQSTGELGIYSMKGTCVYQSGIIK